jgi:hypothetical protein
MMDDSATAQWFANLDGVKQRALDALENVAFYPPAGMDFVLYQIASEDLDRKAKIPVLYQRAI